MAEQLEILFGTDVDLKDREYGPWPDATRTLLTSKNGKTLLIIRELEKLINVDSKGFMQWPDPLLLASENGY
jgi:hypothetical protein